MSWKGALDRTFPRGPLMRARNAYYRVLCSYYERKNWVFHDGGGQWNEIQRVPPEAIQFITYNDHHLDYGHGYLNAGAFDIAKRSGRQIGGKWDTKGIEFRKLHIYTALERRVREGVSWESTRFFEEMVESIRGGERPWGCSSIADLRNRCACIDDLYERIRENGYQSQRSLGKVPVDEVTVNIGRGGTLFFNDGRHRLAIAKILGIETIPVRILVIHEEFTGDVSDVQTDARTPAPVAGQPIEESATND
jgi:hypothetical protein